MITLRMIRDRSRGGRIVKKLGEGKVEGMEEVEGAEGRGLQRNEAVRRLRERRA